MLLCLQSRFNVCGIATAGVVTGCHAHNFTQQNLEENQTFLLVYLFSCISPESHLAKCCCVTQASHCYVAVSPLLCNRISY